MKSGKQRGFTLLELLVAVSIASIVIIGLMAVFRNTLTVYAQIRESRENAMQIRALGGLLGDDLLTVAREFTFTGSTGESGGRFVRLLEFVSGVSVERQDAEPTLTRVLVVYGMTRVGDDEQWALMRGERPHPSIVGWQESPESPESPDSSDSFELLESSIPVLQHVEALKFYYEWLSGTEQDFCSVPPGGALPAYVRMEVVLREGDKTTEYSVRFPLARLLLRLSPWNCRRMRCGYPCDWKPMINGFLLHKYVPMRLLRWAQDPPFSCFALAYGGGTMLPCS